MPFHFCDRLIHDYRSVGFVILRQIVPVSLLRDLRRGSARIPEFNRAKNGPQGHRLQPIRDHLTDAELKPFFDLTVLPELVDAVHKILSPAHTISNGDLHRTSVMTEPANHPWHGVWHRDIRETHDVPDVDEWRRIVADPLWFNQFGCAMYEDSCTWYVPGSHLRTFDFESETRAAAANPVFPDDADDAMRERAGIEYANGMPGAVRACLQAGDLMLYQPLAWHMGCYLSDRRRMTILDYCGTPYLVDWYKRWDASKAAAKARRAEKAAQPAGM